MTSTPTDRWVTLTSVGWLVPATSKLCRTTSKAWRTEADTPQPNSSPRIADTTMAPKAALAQEDMRRAAW